MCIFKIIDGLPKMCRLWHSRTVVKQAFKHELWHTYIFTVPRSHVTCGLAWILVLLIIIILDRYEKERKHPPGLKVKVRAMPYVLLDGKTVKSQGNACRSFLSLLSSFMYTPTAFHIFVFLLKCFHIYTIQSTVNQRMETVRGKAVKCMLV